MDFVEDEFGPVARNFSKVVLSLDKLLEDPVTGVDEFENSLDCSKVFGYSPAASVEDKLQFWDVRGFVPHKLLTEDQSVQEYQEAIKACGRFLSDQLYRSVPSQMAPEHSNYELRQEVVRFLEVTHRSLVDTEPPSFAPSANAVRESIQALLSNPSGNAWSPRFDLVAAAFNLSTGGKQRRTPANPLGSVSLSTLETLVARIFLLTQTDAKVGFLEEEGNHEWLNLDNRRDAAWLNSAADKLSIFDLAGKLHAATAAPFLGVFLVNAVCGINVKYTDTQHRKNICVDILSQFLLEYFAVFSAGQGSSSRDLLTAYGAVAGSGRLPGSPIVMSPYGAGASNTSSVYSTPLHGDIQGNSGSSADVIPPATAAAPSMDVNALVSAIVSQVSNSVKQELAVINTRVARLDDAVSALSTSAASSVSRQRDSSLHRDHLQASSGPVAGLPSAAAGVGVATANAAALREVEEYVGITSASASGRQSGKPPALPTSHTASASASASASIPFSSLGMERAINPTSSGQPDGDDGNAESGFITYMREQCEIALKAGSKAAKLKYHLIPMETMKRLYHLASNPCLFSGPPQTIGGPRSLTGLSVGQWDINMAGPQTFWLDSCSGIAHYVIQPLDFAEGSQSHGFAGCGSHVGIASLPNAAPLFSHYNAWLFPLSPDALFKCIRRENELANARDDLSDAERADLCLALTRYHQFWTAFWDNVKNQQSLKLSLYAAMLVFHLNVWMYCFETRDFNLLGDKKRLTTYASTQIVAPYTPLPQALRLLQYVCTKCQKVRGVLADFCPICTSKTAKGSKAAGSGSLASSAPDLPLHELVDMSVPTGDQSKLPYQRMPYAPEF
jgi:hypothetical protein